MGQWKWLLEVQRVQRGAPWVLGLGIGGVALLAAVGPRPWLVLGYVNVVCVAVGVLIGQIPTTRRWLSLPALGMIATDVLMVCLDPSFWIVH